MKKTKHLIVRISESQFQRLASELFSKHKNKSCLVRDALDNYMDGKERMTDNQNKKDIKNKKSLY